MPNQPSGLLVPAYDYPSDGDEAWNTLTDVGGILGAPGQLMVVVNHDDGHFDSANPDYVTVIAELKGVCASILGYVHDCTTIPRKSRPSVRELRT